MKEPVSNGAYWARPRVDCYAVAKADWPAKQRPQYVQELRAGDFPEAGIRLPWSACIEGDHKQNPVYMTSVTSPLAAFERIDRDRTRK